VRRYCASLLLDEGEKREGRTDGKWGSRKEVGVGSIVEDRGGKRNVKD